MDDDDEIYTVVNHYVMMHRPGSPEMWPSGAKTKPNKTLHRKIIDNEKKIEMPETTPKIRLMVKCA